MIRSIAAVIAGYSVMALWVMLALSLSWMALGPGFAFRGGSVDVSIGWMAVALFTGFLGALLGGFVSARISKTPSGGAVRVLAGIVLVLGLMSAYFQVPPEERPGFEGDITQIGPTEAAEVARQPRWYPYAISLVGCFGVLTGGSARIHARKDRWSGE
ncbi:MAG: hypothetical protein ABIK65_15845 [Candidatus Eisenbacteria bacterium]